MSVYDPKQTLQRTDINHLEAERLPLIPRQGHGAVRSADREASIISDKVAMSSPVGFGFCALPISIALLVAS